MQNKFFTVTATPDIINGDISDFFSGGSGSSSATDMDAEDVVFDWTAIDVPKGVNLLIAKAFDGKVPESLGAPNTAADGGHLRANLIGTFKLDNTDDKTMTAAGPLPGGQFYTVNGNATAAAAPNWGNALPFVINCSGSGTNSGYDKIYIACVIRGAARHFGTNVLANGAVDADATNSRTITVKTTDARLAFSVGDKVYIHTSDTPIPGTLTKVEATKLHFTVANSTIDIADDDEIVCANPFRINLGFER